MRVSDYLFRTLADWGVRQAFLVTGGGAMHLDDALSREPRIRFLCNHHEQACAMAAEAYARDNQPDEALALMNEYLVARGCTPLDESLSGDALVEAILKEKQKEFVGEGTRFFDLKRMGVPVVRYNESGSQAMTIAVDDYRHLFPIPQSEYRYNENITAEHQNPGWSYEVAE